MKKYYILLVLIICCALAGQVSGAEPEWQYTDTYVEEIAVKNIFGGDVGTITLAGYFQYNGVDTPRGVIITEYAGVDGMSRVEKTAEVVLYHHTKSAELSMQVEATADLLILKNALNRQWHLRIFCTPDGVVTQGHDMV